MGEGQRRRRTPMLRPASGKLEEQKSWLGAPLSWLTRPRDNFWSLSSIIGNTETFSWVLLDIAGKKKRQGEAAERITARRSSDSRQRSSFDLAIRFSSMPSLRLNARNFNWAYKSEVHKSSSEAKWQHRRSYHMAKSLSPSGSKHLFQFLNPS